jgi:hypothetical protein
MSYGGGQTGKSGMHRMSDNTEHQDNERLVIRKKSQQDIIYHYNREKRIGTLRSGGHNQKKGIFRKNSILLILIADILIIIIIFVFLRWSEWGNASRTTFSGYSLVLDAYWIKDRVFARLKIREDRKESVRTRMEGSVRFYQNDEEYCEKPFILPSAYQDKIELSCSFLSKAIESTVYADIVIGNVTKRLSVKPHER